MIGQSTVSLRGVSRGRVLDPTYPGVHGGGGITSRLDTVVKWGRRSSAFARGLVGRTGDGLFWS
jgi:hypothetical protein